MAQEDGVNPYTALPLRANPSQPDTQFSAGQTAAAGLGSAVSGAAVLEAYHHHQNEPLTPSSTDPGQLEALAAEESSKVTAPDTNEHQAAQEAILIAAPDILSPPISESNAMSEGRSPGVASDLELDRPSTQSHQSNFSISQLHIPGEFPKGKDGKPIA